jgi:hypothetical protein
LYPKAGPGIVPLQALILTGDQAGATFQAALPVDLDPTLWVQGVQVCRADEKARAELADGLAYLLIDGNVRLFVQPKDVQAKFSLDVHGVSPLHGGY